jgi:hypothetical protein
MNNERPVGQSKKRINMKVSEWLFDFYVSSAKPSPMTRIGIILTAFGTLYLIKPNIYRSGFWKRTDIAQQKLAPAQYTKYMRILGGLFVIAGILLVVIDR